MEDILPGDSRHAPPPMRSSAPARLAYFFIGCARETVCRETQCYPERRRRDAKGTSLRVALLSGNSNEIREPAISCDEHRFPPRPSSVDEIARRRAAHARRKIAPVLRC